MRVRGVRGLIFFVGVILALPVVAYAQGATLAGTVRDSSGAVLPGVSVTVRAVASGNTYEAVTDAAGTYRVIVRPGVYEITARLAGFQTVVRANHEVLIGQTLTVGFELGISSLEETVTVTGEQPLLDVSSSTVSGNIDPRQIEQLPINGRNWMDLALLAPGSRQNASAEVPLDRQGYFQMVVDGQQITQLICCSGRQPRYSQDAIGEFELISNRFDASVGRSAGQVVNAVTKSGTNSFRGSVAGYFRHDSMQAADPVADRVIPFQEQQISGTFGGPIRKDRVHFFANYEYDRTPFTVTFNSVYPQLNKDVSAKDTLETGGGRVDIEVSPRTRLALRYMRYKQVEPFNGTGGASNGPSTGETLERSTNQVFGSLTNIIGTAATNQLKFGIQAFNWKNKPDVMWQGDTGGFPADAIPGVYPGWAPTALKGSLRLEWSNYSMGTANNSPQDITESIIQVRDDFTMSFDRGGVHDIKAGGEYLHNKGEWEWCNGCNGRMRFFGNAPANLPDFIGDPLDASTWNLAGLAPVVRPRDWIQSIGNPALGTTRDIFAFWFQDDYSVGDRLTLNLGVRYDVDIGVEGERETFTPWVVGRKTDWNNLAPRLGAVFRLDDRTVLRGGYGIYYTQLENDAAHQTQLNAVQAGNVIPYDGRADFLVNPWNGLQPSYNDVTFCNEEPINRPGCFSRSFSIEVPAPRHEISYSHQAMAGIERQLSAQSVLVLNYNYTGGRAEEHDHNAQLMYDEATGLPLNPNSVANRQFPGWGPVVGLEFMEGRSNYHALEVSIRKRLSDRWQAQFNYKLSGWWDEKSPPRIVSLPGPTASNYSFPLAGLYGGEYTLAVGDQRHRATFNGIWELAYGFQLSGVYFFGSGERFPTMWGNGACGNVGAAFCSTSNPRNEEARLRPDGTLVPRNNLVGKPLHRLDVRLTKRFDFGGVGVSGIVDVFNVFNHKNYGDYTTLESNANYGKPEQNRNTSYLPTTVQLGFRVTF